jgi:hypothetical protein
MLFNGTTPAYGVTLKGSYNVNSSAWN